MFFKVSSFPEYGKLSNRIIDDSLSGVRKSVEPGKLDDGKIMLYEYIENNGNLCLAQELCNNNNDEFVSKVKKIVI